MRTATATPDERELTDVFFLALVDVEFVNGFTG